MRGLGERLDKDTYEGMAPFSIRRDIGSARLLCKNRKKIKPLPRLFETDFSVLRQGSTNFFLNIVELMLV